MRQLLTTLSLFLVCCRQTESKQQENKRLERYWISKHLEPYAIDSAVGGGQTVYGGGFLLRLDTNGQVASLGADFYWENDSLYQGGEPGMTVKFGKWKQFNHNLILNQKLLAKTIMLTSDQIGQLESDTIRIERTNLLIRDKDSLTPVRKPSKALEELLNKVITFHINQNGS